MLLCMGLEHYPEARSFSHRFFIFWGSFFALGYFKVLRVLFYKLHAYLCERNSLSAHNLELELFQVLIRLTPRREMISLGVYVLDSTRANLTLTSEMCLDRISWCQMLPLDVVGSRVIARH